MQLSTKHLLGIKDLTKEDIATEALLALDGIELAIDYIFRGLQVSWDRLLARCDEHVSILVGFTMKAPN